MRAASRWSEWRWTGCAEFEGRGVDVQDRWWGYRLLVVRDPDGNELYFNYPSNDEPPPRERA
jgi:hypothetical protein